MIARPIPFSYKRRSDSKKRKPRRAPTHVANINYIPEFIKMANKQTLASTVDMNTLIAAVVAATGAKKAPSAREVMAKIAAEKRAEAAAQRAKKKDATAKKSVKPIVGGNNEARLAHPAALDPFIDAQIQSVLDLAKIQLKAKDKLTRDHAHNLVTLCTELLAQDTHCTIEDLKRCSIALYRLYV